MFRSVLGLGFGLGLGTILHWLPSQCNTNVRVPPVVRLDEPTAHTSFGETTATPSRVLSVELGLGLGTLNQTDAQVGVGVAVSAGTAPGAELAHNAGMGDETCAHAVTGGAGSISIAKSNRLTTA